MIETALWGLSLLITAAVCFWVGVGVGRGESVPRDRIMEICDTCATLAQDGRKNTNGKAL